MLWVRCRGLGEVLEWWACTGRACAQHTRRLWGLLSFTPAHALLLFPLPTRVLVLGHARTRTPLLSFPPALQTLPLLKGVKQEQMEQILDRFDAREEMFKGHTIAQQGQMVRQGDWARGRQDGLE